MTMNSNTLMVIASIGLLSVGLVALLKSTNRLQKIIDTLLILLVVQLFGEYSNISSQYNVINGIIGTFVAVNLASSSLISQFKFRWIVPAISFLLLFLLGKNQVMYEEYTLDFSQLKVIGIVALGFISGVFSNGLIWVFKRFFNEEDTQLIGRVAQIVFMSLFLIPATFLVSWYGVLLLSIGFYTFNLYTEYKSNFHLSLLLIAITAPLAQYLGVDTVDLTVGKIIAGIAVGISCFALIYLAVKSTNKLISILFLLLGFILLITISKLDQIHPAYGGSACFIAALIGLALALCLGRNGKIAGFILPATILIGLFVLQNENVNSAVQTTEASTEPAIKATEETDTEPKGISAAALTGKYTLNAQASTINFELGPKGGVTKGAIQEVEGTVDFGSDISTAKFKIKMTTKKLTTFNSMRDESVWGAAYLNAPKFPIMSFESNSMIAKDDGYIVKGKFTLLGRTNEEEVFVKFIGEKDGKLQFFGKSTVDRTRYGMASSPQEGNIVRYNFTIELQ